MYNKIEPKNITYGTIKKSEFTNFIANKNVVIIAEKKFPAKKTSLKFCFLKTTQYVIVKTTIANVNNIPLLKPFTSNAISYQLVAAVRFVRLYVTFDHRLNYNSYYD